jgi:pre-mRNA-splicing factor ATP-dependent RNA helicase DHX15/PRP43
LQLSEGTATRHTKEEENNKKMSDGEDTNRGGKRLSADTDEPSRKKAKKADGEGKYNPYLAHMEDNNGTSRADEPMAGSPFAGMKRRQTTAKQAAKIEDDPSNAFTGQEHTNKYFQILETRRELPVHKQRYIQSNYGD